MADELLGDRRKALEEEFFARQNEKLRRELREKQEGKARRDALAAASGIGDGKMLDQIVALGVDAGTLAALSLVPLVEVAWADGSIDAKERSAVLGAAEKQGFGRGTPAYGLLEGWLGERPRPELMTTWREYAGAVARSLSDDARRALRDEILGRARAVAEAAGGILGLGAKVSKAEEAVLKELDRAFA